MLKGMRSADDDVDLMLRYRDGDTEAFARLYARHKASLYRYLLRQVRNAGVASDLFQEVWSRLIATRARYEPRAKFATFLFHIAHNCAMDFFRRSSVHAEPQAELDVSVAEAPEHLRPDRVAEFTERQSVLLAALAALPYEQRETFVLHEESGLSVEEIARITAVPAETAKSRLRYAVRKLKSSLEAAEEPAALPLRVRTI